MKLFLCGGGSGKQILNALEKWKKINQFCIYRLLWMLKIMIVVIIGFQKK